MPPPRPNPVKETDLYAPVRDWLASTGWQVRGEVKGCDVAALDGERLVLVELKTALNFDVVLQAVDRQRLADTVYVAVPARARAMARARWKLAVHLLKRLELGLLLVTLPGPGVLRPRVDEAVPPVPFDRARSQGAAKRRREALLREFRARTGDRNRGGSVGTQIVTAYREQALHVAAVLQAQGPLSPKALRAAGCDAGKTLPILHDNHYGWFERVSRGLYRLTAAGEAALGRYRDG